MTPLVSILIPAFNAEDWIADTIKSAIGQTWRRKEIIIVDDGSTDQTVPIAQRFASKDLRVVTQPNQGASAARNTAFGLCQGDLSNGWTPTICLPQTRSPGKWRPWKSGKKEGSSYLPPGGDSCT